MSKKEKINETIENEEVIEQIEQKEEPKTEGFITKFKNGAKKHGGKILAVAGIGVAAVIGYALGGKKTKSEDDCYCDAIDVEVVDASELEADIK